jgi:hypothetical protein
MPKRKDGTFDIEACRKWRDFNISQKPKKDPNVVELMLAEKKYTVANKKHQARERKVKADKAEQKVYVAADVDAWILEAFNRVKSRIEQWPTEVKVAAPNNVRDQVRSDLHRLTRLLLTEIAGFEFSPE